MPPPTLYDDNGPADPQWASASHDDRVAAVLSHHAALGGRHAAQSDPTLHARLHVTIEDQLLAGAAGVAEFFERFGAAGVRRHEIVHAASAAFAEAMRAAASSGQTDAGSIYAERLARLEPAEWIARAVRRRSRPDPGRD